MTTQPPPAAARRRARPRWPALVLLAAGLWLGVVGSWLGPVDREAAARPAAPPAPEHACRFWGIVGTDCDSALILNQLRDDPSRSFKRLGSANPDGWGFAVFPSDTLRSAQPLLRRGRPYPGNPHASEFDLAVEELEALDPRAVLANVRLDDVRHLGVPDPHPFVHDGIAFVHSGNVRDTSALENIYLTPSYLEQHPPDYTSPKMDSELLFLYLLKLIHEFPDVIPEAIHTAVVQLAPVTQDDRLDCAFTRGDTLYALRYAGADPTEPLLYYPAGAGAPAASPFWVVATQIVGGSPDAWAEIPAHTLAVFVPHESVQFYPVGPRGDEAGPPGGRARKPTGSDGTFVPLKTRFWGLVGAGYPTGLCDEHLRQPGGLATYGGTGSLGWGIASYSDEVPPGRLELPLFYRGGPSAADPYDPDYDIAAGEIASVRPRAAVGHVRAASSSHPDVPDPHPFQHNGLVFVHNGSLDATPLFDFLQNTEPADFLETHPPEYVSGHIDSELYMLYLLKYLYVHPELARAEGLRQAVRALGGEVGGSRLNFLMTAGDTLYALRYNDAQGVVYGPGDLVTASPYWVAASESVGRGMAWHTIPEHCLVAFVPGQVPALYPIDAGQEPAFDFASVGVCKLQDQDGDGWSPHVEVCCDPNVEWGSAQVSLRLLARAQGGEWRLLLDTEARTIVGDAVDTAFCADFWVAPDTLAPDRWDLWLQLLSGADPGAVLAEATGQTHPGSGLNHLAVEGAARDTTNDLPPRLRVISLGVLHKVDLDEDGYARSFEVDWSTTLEHAQELDVYAKLYWSDGMHMPAYLQGEAYRVHAGSPAPGNIELVVRPPNLQPVAWECYLELFDAAAETLAARVTADDFESLRAIDVEGEAQDDPEPPAAVWIGAARPNPGDGRIDVPVGIPEGGALLRLEVFDTQGRLVRTLGPVQGDAGVTALSWDGRDSGNRAVPAGIYYLNASAGGQHRLMRCVVVRAGDR